jgi:hypothetical protein
MVYFLAVYLLNELSCNLGYLTAEVAGLTVAALISLLFMILLLAVLGYAGYLANNIRKQAQPAAPAPETLKSDNTAFIGLSGLLLAVLFALLTVAVGAAVLLLQPC